MSKPTIFLLIILLLGFYIRLINFDYPITNGEAHRDYIVARHIIKYKEFPLTGPCCLFNNTFGEIRNNPVYYYSLAAFLLIKDDILLLSFINLIFQVLSIFIIYFLAKNLFGQNTALIATLLYSISYIVLKQSLYMWQPYLMSFFVNLSYLTLLLFYLRRKFWLLLISIFLFLYSGSLHNPAYGVLPSFAVLSFLILKKQGSPFKNYLFSAFFALGILILFYFTFFVHFLENRNELNLPTSFKTIFSFSISPTSTLINSFFSGDFLAILVVTVCALHVCIRLSGKKRIYFYIFLLTLFQFLVVASLFKTTIWDYYFTPIFGIFIILISYVLSETLKRNFLTKTALAIILLILIIIFSRGFALFKFHKFGSDLELINNASSALGKEIEILQKKEGFKKKDFFTIKKYSLSAESKISDDLVFWSYFEKKMKEKFIKVYDKDFSYKYLNSDEYIFVICQSSESRIINIKLECIEPFSKKYKGYKIIRDVYKDSLFNIFLARKT